MSLSIPIWEKTVSQLQHGQFLQNLPRGRSGVVAGPTANHNEPSVLSDLLQVVFQATQEHCVSSRRGLTPRGSLECMCSQVPLSMGIL